MKTTELNNAKIIEAEDKKVVVVSGKTDAHKEINLRLVLSPEEYRVACDAHRDNMRVSVRGMLERHGKYWLLTSPEDFRLL